MIDGLSLKQEKTSSHEYIVIIWEYITCHRFSKLYLWAQQYISVKPICDGRKNVKLSRSMNSNFWLQGFIS